jgi:tRNA(fMet)-specific endonuclease VapC
MLLDTSFLVDLLSGLPQAQSLAEEVDRTGEVLRLPAPALYELWIGAGKSLKREDEIARLEVLALAYEIVPFTANDARRSGLLQAGLLGRGRPLSTIDIQIAGMSIERNETLLTADRGLLKLGHGLRARSYGRS